MKKRVLNDHKKVGSKLIPPLLEIMGESSYSYIKNGIPEIIWLSILNKNFGHREGTQIAVNFVEVIDKLKIKDEVPYFISWFSDLKQSDINLIKQKLIEAKLYTKLEIGLAELIKVYPTCPLGKLFQSSNHTDNDLLFVKETLSSIYNKRSRAAVLTLANVVYLLAVCKKMSIAKGITTDLSKVAEYPATEESKRAASFMRATTNVLLNKDKIPNGEEWLRNFWNRGLELEPCNI